MKAVLRYFACLFLGLSTVFAADEVLTDKSSSAKVMALYQKVLAGAQKAPPAPGGIICIGSSHMQFWKSVKTDLAPLTVHNYGIGGSRMNQAAEHFVDNLAIPFKPRAVILYEGSNDINAGAKPETVLENFRKLSGKLHAACRRRASTSSASCPAPASASSRSPNSGRRTNCSPRSAPPSRG